MNENKEHYNNIQILDSHGIKPTKERLEILKIIQEQLPEDISINALHDIVIRQNLKIGFSTIIVTLGLFRIRGLLIEINTEAINRRPGRPQTRLVYMYKVN